jgi:hypothetical protein
VNFALKAKFMQLSFISEHSLEYIVVPNICKILRAKYKRIIPIYYWVTREGNTLSRNLHSNIRVRILAVFPRRPKIDSNHSDVIFGKLNNSILHFAGAAKSIGIPTIFCMPIVKSFLDISEDSECLYLDVLKHNEEDIHFHVNNKDDVFSIDSEQKANLTILDSSAILKIQASGKMMNWDEANLNMNQLRNVNDIYSRFWMSQYKPVYLILLE